MYYAYRVSIKHYNKQTHYAPRNSDKLYYYYPHYFEETHKNYQGLNKVYDNHFNHHSKDKGYDNQYYSNHPYYTEETQDTVVSKNDKKYKNLDYLKRGKLNTSRNSGKGALEDQYKVNNNQKKLSLL